MIVRAKMSAGYVPPRGDRGAEISFNAVYESNEKLKQISENAIFGNSTPSGSVSLAGDLPVEKFQDAAGESFYVDISQFDNEPAGALITFRARRVYQSAPTSKGEKLVVFRYAVIEPLAGDVRLQITNGAASEFLIANEFVTVAIRVAMGRRSLQEIALLREVLAERVASVVKYNAAKLDAMQPDERAKTIEAWTRSDRHRLWRALGHTTAYTPGVSLDDPQAALDETARLKDDNGL